MRPAKRGKNAWRSGVSVASRAAATVVAVAATVATVAATVADSKPTL